MYRRTVTYQSLFALPPSNNPQISIDDRISGGGARGEMESHSSGMSVGESSFSVLEFRYL